MVGRAELLFSEVLNALRLLVEKNFGPGLPSSGKKAPESRHQMADLEAMLQKEKVEFEVSTHFSFLYLAFSFLSC